MHNKKEYIIVKDRHPRFSEVLNDCAPLCVPTYKNETLSSVLQKICAKITAIENSVADGFGPIYLSDIEDFATATGSPITDTGTLGYTLNPQPAHYVFAGPISGADAIPTFRPLVEDDIPPLPYIPNPPDGLLSGGQVTWTGTGLEFDVAPAIYRIGGVDYTSPQTLVTLDPADPTDDRIDVFYVDTDGNVGFITGTPEPNPVKPQIDPATQIELTSVYIPAGALIPLITTLKIYDENIEWVTSQVGTTVDFNDAADPQLGSIDADVTNISDGDYLLFTHTTNVDITLYDSLSMFIKLKAVLASTANLLVSFQNAAGTQVTNEVVVPINKSNITTYQGISIPVTFFNQSEVVRKFRIRYSNPGVISNHAGFFADNIYLQDGIQPPITPFLYTAANAVTLFGTQFQLGGSLIKDTSISTGPYALTLSGATTPSFNFNFNVVNSTGSSIKGQTTTGTGVQGVSAGANGFGVFGQNTVGQAGGFLFTNSSGSTSATTVGIYRATTGTPAAGMGANLTFFLSGTTTPSTANLPSNRIVSTWTNATTLSQTSQLVITGINAAVEADLFTLSGNGALRLNKYGVNTFTGTMVKYLAVTSTGQVIEVDAGAGGEVISADNGIVENTPGNVQLGSSTAPGSALLHNSFINSDTFYLQLIGTGTQNLRVENTGSGNGLQANSTTGNAVNALSSSSGIGVSGSSSSGAGVLGTSTSGNGVTGISSSAVGIQGTTSTGVSVRGYKFSSITNAVTTQLQLSHGSSGTTAAGFGTAVDFQLQDASGIERTSTRFISRWTDATAGTRTSQVIITGVNNAVSADLFTLSGSGALQLNKYGINTFAGTPAYALGTDVSGNIIEFAVPSGGSGEVNTASNLGGGLDNFDSKSGVDLRFNSFNAADFNLASNLISIDYVNGQAASGSTKGFLTSTDWTTFNNKLSAVTADNGLSTSSSSNVRLGGSALLANTSILTSAFNLTIPSSSASPTLVISNSSTGNAISATAVGASAAAIFASGLAGGAIYATSSSTSTAVFGSCSAGTGVNGAATTGTGVVGSATTGTAGAFYNTFSSTSAVGTNLIVSATVAGTAANGFGNSIDYYLKCNTTTFLSAKQISTWTTATEASRTSAYELWLTNTAVNARKLKVAGNGQLTLDTYGINTFAGTPTFALGVDGSGNVVEFAVGGGGSESTTASNGLTEVGDDIRLGGTLSAGTTINSNTFGLTLTGSVAGNSFTVVNNEATGIVYGVHSTATGTSSSGVVGIGGNAGVQGISTNGTGVIATSTNSYGLSATSSGGAGANIQTSRSSTNTIEKIIDLTRNTTGTAANGIGGSIDINLESSTGSAITANQIISSWTNATHASRTSQLVFTGVDNTTTADLFTLSGTGALRLNKYGVSTFTGTVANYLAVDSSGNVIETASTGGGYSESETSVTSDTTPNPVGDERFNYYDATALAGGATFAAPSGTPANHNRLTIRIKDDGTARSLAWNAIYRGGTTVTLPTTTVVNLTMYVDFIYNSADSTWDCIGVAEGY